MRAQKDDLGLEITGMMRVNFLLIFLIFDFAELKPIDGLAHYELLSYSPLEVLLSTDGNVEDVNDFDDSNLPPKCLEKDVAHITFEAYSRNFSLRLQKVCQGEVDDAELLTNSFRSEAENVHKEIVYFQGTVEGESNSTVDGTIQAGVFQGIIITEDRNKYIVEKLETPMNGAHSIIFHVHSKKEIVAALFGEGSGEEVPVELFESSGDSDF